MENTANLFLPYIMPSQAQKHVTHNEALRVLDALVQLSVASRSQSEPPGSPAEGERHIVADAAGGAWSGWDGDVACFVDGGWARFSPKSGWRAWVEDEEALCVFDGAAWSAFSPGGAGAFDTLGVNAAADEANRLAVSSAASLFSHDGGGHQMKINKDAAGDTASLLFQTGFSGRAEIGTTGDDHFHFKVSADGSQWTDALRIHSATGALSLDGGTTDTITGNGFRFAVGTGNLRIGMGLFTENRAHLDLYSNGNVPADIHLGVGSLTTANLKWNISSRQGSGGTAGVTSGQFVIYEGPMNTGSGYLPRIVIQPGGNIGIGTSSPTARLHVDGSLSKSSGSFDIPHPDPVKTQSHRLRHCFVESPTRGDNIYRFAIEAREGEETVAVVLPDYWRHLNEAGQVWVSPDGHFGRAHGRVDQAGATLLVTCETPGAYSVLLIGTRKDAAARDWFDADGVEYEAAPAG